MASNTGAVKASPQAVGHIHRASTRRVLEGLRRDIGQRIELEKVGSDWRVQLEQWAQDLDWAMRGSA